MNVFYRYRSAITGRFITARQALMNAATSVAERIRKLVARNG